MTDNKRKPRPVSDGASKPIVRHEYKDPSGISRVVLLPAGDQDVSAGIPVSLDLTPLFGHMPDPFQRDLYAALHAQGLVDAADYFKKGAAERFRAALFTVIKHDFLNVQALAKEELS